MAQPAPPTRDPTASEPHTSTTSIPPSADPSSPAVESPSLSYPSARARFEFEPGRGNTGTKILMVEWEDDASTADVRGAWTVSWEGKSHVVPAEDKSEDRGAATEHRLFFMLPPGASVPRTVTLTLRPQGSGAEVVWKTNPLPAIFPPELSAPQQTRGKGVLHTLWAKKRLRTLAAEIEREAAENVEGVALAMALREKEWIEGSFGVSLAEQQPQPARKPPRSIQVPHRGEAPAPLSPSTPLSPGGSRLAEKLRGLRLQTGEGELRRDGPVAEPGLVSPDESDVAVPSFSAFRGANSEVLAAKPAQAPAARRLVPAAAPAPAFKARGQESMASLSGMVSGDGAGAAGGSIAESRAGNGEKPEQELDGDEEEELFALPLSPRSPDMTKSPFAFTGADTARYAQANANANTKGRRRMS